MAVRLMRLPTYVEWDALADIVHEKDDIMHWEFMYSWGQEINTRGAMVLGYFSARQTFDGNPAFRGDYVGFRLVFEALGSELSVPDGTIITAGTLYMGDTPVKVPVRPTYLGDVTNYVPGTKLEMREALDDPAYQVRAIKVGDALVSDRALINYISWHDIQGGFD